jgi:hypothetical protein
MAESTLVKKMKLKAGTRAAVLNAPAGYLKELAPLPAGVEVSEKLQGRFDWIQAFVRTSAELNALGPRLVKALADESLLWISFPKGTSGIQTDLTRDKGWDALKGVDLRWVTLISVNATWSAFCLRPYKPGETRQPTWL